ncbi:hypothetical protein [Paracoccus binzhouensis]|uniref:hypothetical protein n=1 Tax=Paracoccus binzhouensis TaxID=2796149 RepID=UPI0018EECF09|nr:hypothetical protein [Paracoccus binzhouensis]
MIGQQPAPRGWALAAGLSLAVHAAAAGAVLWQPNWHWSDGPTEPAQITVTALPVPTAPESEVLEPVSTPMPPEQAPPELAGEAEEVSAPEPEPEPVAQSASPVLTNTALPTAGRAETPAPMPAAGEDGPAEAETDPRLAELFDRIRSQLTAPCLLALPALDAEGGIRLNLLASDDAQIPGLLRALTQGLETQVAGQAVLLDPRQCAGLAFARRDARYPVFPLAIRLQSQDVASGDSLRGTISGGAGRYVTLLMIDDNGVTHDLRRFLVNAGGRIRFDVPVARDGADRDTHQLLLAVATPKRPETVSRAAGELAEDFLDQFAREIGPEALIGVGSVYVRQAKP